MKTLNEADYLKIGGKTYPTNMMDYDPDMNAKEVENETQRRIQTQQKAEQEAKKYAEYAAKKAQLRQDGENHWYNIQEDPQYKDVIPSEKLCAFFEELVPSSGKADSIGGEIVRAMMRMLYRYQNDGDYFYKGYGCETAGPAANFLADIVPDVGEQLYEIEERQLEDGNYEEQLEDICTTVMDFLEKNLDLLAEPSGEDYLRVYDDWEEVAENEFDIDTSGVDQLVEEGVISWDDAYSELDDMVRNDSELDGAELRQLARDAFVIDNLTTSQFEYCNDYFQKWVDDWVNELQAEYEESEDNEEDDEWDQLVDDDSLDDDFV